MVSSHLGQPCGVPQETLGKIEDIWFDYGHKSKEFRIIVGSILAQAPRQPRAEVNRQLENVLYKLGDCFGAAFRGRMVLLCSAGGSNG